MEATPGRGLVQSAYDRLLRPRLPRKLAVCNGVVARRVRLLDRTDHMPDYEHSLLATVREQVETGDDVLEIGGGFGVATVVAARQAGDEGRLRSYEGSHTHADLVRETAELNGVADRVEVVPAVVGTARDVWGQSADEVRAPGDLDPADVLILDCEGAEADIVPALCITPRVVVVEVHTEAGASVEAIRTELDDRGYEVRDESATAGSVPGVVLTAVQP